MILRILKSADKLEEKRKHVHKDGEHGCFSSKDVYSDALPCIPRLNTVTSLGSILRIIHPSFRHVIFKLLFIDHLIV